MRRGCDMGRPEFYGLTIGLESDGVAVGAKEKIKR
jgi:hypothetical protein